MCVRVCVYAWKSWWFLATPSGVWGRFNKMAWYILPLPPVAIPRRSPFPVLARVSPKNWQNWACPGLGIWVNSPTQFFVCGFLKNIHLLATHLFLLPPVLKGADIYYFKWQFLRVCLYARELSHFLQSLLEQMLLIAQGQKAGNSICCSFKGCLWLCRHKAGTIRKFNILTVIQGKMCPFSHNRSDLVFKVCKSSLEI